MNSRLIVQQQCVLNKSEIVDMCLLFRKQNCGVHYAEAHTPFVHSFFSKQRAAQSRANTHTWTKSGCRARFALPFAPGTNCWYLQGVPIVSCPVIKPLERITKYMLNVCAARSQAGLLAAGVNYLAINWSVRGVNNALIWFLRWATAWKLLRFAQLFSRSNLAFDLGRVIMVLHNCRGEGAHAAIVVQFNNFISSFEWEGGILCGLFVELHFEHYS